jgi:pimeloyl-ACP methyl ester carboxylesterase
LTSTIVEGSGPPMLDVLALMRRLGHERFAVAGHDRGVLVAQRLALEHPDSVSHLAVLPEERPDEVAKALRDLTSRSAP